MRESCAGSGDEDDTKTRSHAADLISQGNVIGFGSVGRFELV